LKHGAAVEVLEPPELRRRVKQRVEEMQALYAAE
jgi:predicted DNA-binding transcriptional regulator YafY